MAFDLLLPLRFRISGSIENEGELLLDLDLRLWLIVLVSDILFLLPCDFTLSCDRDLDLSCLLVSSK